MRARCWMAQIAAGFSRCKMRARYYAPRLSRIKGHGHVMNHLLSIQSLTDTEILELLALAAEMKAARGRHAIHPLRHQCWGMIFNKSSTRTRVSFEVGIRELGGDVLFLNANDIQLGRGELIKDTARVLGRMLHGAVIRTFAQQDVEDFAEHSG